MRLQLMSWPEVADYLDRCQGIVVPVGSTEQHGPNGLVGTDALVAEAIAWRAAREGDDLLVGPTLAYAPAQFNLDFAGTVSVRASTLTRIVEDVIASLARTGFRHLYFVNGHGANIAAVRSAFHDAHQSMVLARRGPPLRLRLRSWWELPETDALRRRLYGAREGMHATPSEVAVTRALHPDIDPAVEMAAHVALDAAYLRDHAGDAHDDAITHRRAFPDGRVGSDPALANREDGEALLATAARELHADYRRFLEESPA
ncbi:MAG: creatininase family protein [Ectothiorhodospiraceae bacterium]|nr:creatininase family protein [Ectothiorhodospiraceae bacterium]